MAENYNSSPSGEMKGNSSSDNPSSAGENDTHTGASLRPPFIHDLLALSDSRELENAIKCQ